MLRWGVPFLTIDDRRTESSPRLGPLRPNQRILKSLLLLAEDVVHNTQGSIMLHTMNGRPRRVEPFDGWRAAFLRLLRRDDVFYVVFGDDGEQGGQPGPSRSRIAAFSSELSRRASASRESADVRLEQIGVMLCVTVLHALDCSCGFDVVEQTVRMAYLYQRRVRDHSTLERRDVSLHAREG